MVYKAESSLRSVYASALAESSLVALSAKPLEEASVLVQEDTSAILWGEASAVHRKEPPGARSTSSGLPTHREPNREEEPSVGHSLC